MRRAMIQTIQHAAVAAIALGLSASTFANFPKLAQKLPAGTNAIVAVNVAKLLETPYAKAEDWAKTTADAWAKQPMMIPPGATRLLMASEVRTDTMENYWEMSLIEMKQVPDLQSLAAAEGGNIDRVWDKDAVASPINAYFIPLDGTTLASITPANRTAVSKWVRTPTTRPEGNVTSDYIQHTLAGLNEKTDITMAMDLEGAFGVPRIRRFLADNEIKGIEEKQMDRIAGTLGSMQGIKLDITVGQDVNGRATVSFDRDTAELSECAKPIMIAVLNNGGMHLDDIDDWTCTAVGKTVTMQGKLSTGALRKLLSIVQSPIPAITVAQPQSAGAKAVAAADPAVASQRYFKAVCAMLDNFKGASSPSESASWARATSKRIDQLPILNVDPQLIQWGSNVSLKLKQAGAGMAVAQTQMNARVAGVADPSYTGTYDQAGEYKWTSTPGEMENANRQRRQAALEQKAQAQEQTARILTEVAETRPAIRAAMVEKYKVEF